MGTYGYLKNVKGEKEAMIKQNRYEERKRNQLQLIYDVILFSVLITFNIYFAIFVWYPSDLSPNSALLFVTLPLIIIQLIKFIKGIQKDVKKR